MSTDYVCPNCGASFSLPFGKTCDDHNPQPVACVRLMTSAPDPDRINDEFADAITYLAKSVDNREAAIRLISPEQARQEYPLPADDGEAAIRREVAACEEDEIERTELAANAFKAKMAEWRRTGGVPAYHGPKAAQ